MRKIGTIKLIKNEYDIVVLNRTEMGFREGILEKGYSVDLKEGVLYIYPYCNAEITTKEALKLAVMRAFFKEVGFMYDNYELINFVALQLEEIVSLREYSEGIVTDKEFVKYVKAGDNKASKNYYTVPVVGTEWQVWPSKRTANRFLDDCDGLCIFEEKMIFLNTNIDEAMTISANREYYISTLTHELIHALFEEMGFNQSCDWGSQNETVIDLIANQSGRFKIFNAKLDELAEKIDEKKSKEKISYREVTVKVDK